MGKDAFFVTMAKNISAKEGNVTLYENSDVWGLQTNAHPVGKMRHGRLPDRHAITTIMRRPPTSSKDNAMDHMIHEQSNGT
jgi:hypothetical protein